MKSRAKIVKLLYLKPPPRTFPNRQFHHLITSRRAEPFTTESLDDNNTATMMRGWGGLRSVPKAVIDEEEEDDARSPPPSPPQPEASTARQPDHQLHASHTQQLDNFGEPIQPGEQQRLVQQPVSFGVNTAESQPFQPQTSGPPAHPAHPAQTQLTSTDLPALPKRSFDPSQAQTNKKAKKTAETVDMKCERCLYQKQACSGPPECERCNELETVCTWVQPVTGEKITPAKAVEIEHQFPKRGGPWAGAQARAIAAGRPLWKKKEPAAGAAVVAEEAEEEGEEEDKAEETNAFSLGEEEAAVGEIDGEEYELAPDASANLNLSWGSSRVEMSHYSHGDASGVGMTSNLQRALGLPVGGAGAGGAGVGVGVGGGGGPALGGVGAGAGAGEEEPDVGELSVPTQDWELAYMGGEKFW